MAVPEAAVDEQRGSFRGENEVGLAGQVSAVEAEAEAERVSSAAHFQFGRGVARFHGAHDGGALRGIEDVNHQLCGVASA